MDETKYVFSRTSKKQILTVALQNCVKLSFERPCKNLSYLFVMNCFAKFSRQTLSKR